MTRNWDYHAINIREIVPQAYPFVFVDQLEDFDITTLSCITTFTIKEDTLLLEENAISESGLLENMAQTCAVHIGFYNKYVYDRDIQVGFIGAVKNLRIFGKAQISETLTTQITIKTEFGTMKIADATITCNGKLIAEGELKIALQE